MDLLRIVTELTLDQKYAWLWRFQRDGLTRTHLLSELIREYPYRELELTQFELRWRVDCLRYELTTDPGLMDVDKVRKYMLILDGYSNNDLMMRELEHIRYQVKMHMLDCPDTLMICVKDEKDVPKIERYNMKLTSSTRVGIVTFRYILDEKFLRELSRQFAIAKLGNYFLKSSNVNIQLDDICIDGILVSDSMARLAEYLITGGVDCLQDIVSHLEFRVRMKGGREDMGKKNGRNSMDYREIRELIYQASLV